MSVAHPLLEPIDPPFGAVVARQISVWPFAARMQRLFLLVDPSAPTPQLRDGIVRAMQQAYFRSDGQSQTRCVREAALAAHYVLKHNNHDVLPLDQVCAATAVAAVRGQVAFAALAGDASAFAWRKGRLSGLYGSVRLARPLGLDAEPHVALWSSALEPGDRLVLVCGAEGHPDAPDRLREVLQLELSAEETEQRAAEALGSNRPAGVLVVEPTRRHLRLLPPPTAHASHAIEPEAATPTRARFDWRRAIVSTVGIVLLAALALGGFGAFSPPTAPHAAPAAANVDTADHVVSVNPELAVRLGPSGGNVIDMAVADDALYTLDVVENSVRAFGLDARDQQPLPDTIVARSGAAITGTSRRLDQPIAIQAVGGGLTIVDAARSVVQVGHDRHLALATPSSSATWGELGSLGTDLATHLYVLDSAADRLLDYVVQNQKPIDPPRVVLDSGRDLPWRRVAEVVGVQGETFLRFDDGSVRHFAAGGEELGFAPQAPDGRAPTIAGITPDRAGGLYLADAANARILHTTADGEYVRELRHPALAGVRQLKSSADGRRLYGLVSSGVLTFDVPDADPGN